jgi:hypothetical protein
MILINNIRKSSNALATNNTDLLITNLNKLVSPISLSTFNLRRQQRQPQNEPANNVNSTNNIQAITNDKLNSKYLLPTNVNTHKRKRACDQFNVNNNNNTHSTHESNKKRQIDYELIRTCENSMRLAQSDSKVKKPKVSIISKAKTTRRNFNSQVLLRKKHATTSTSTMASTNNCISYTQFGVNLDNKNRQQKHKSKRSSLCEDISVIEKTKNTLKSKYNFKPSKKSLKMAFDNKEKVVVSQKAASKSTFSFLQNPSSSSLSATLASFLKRQIGKSSLTMNSTEIDSLEEMKKFTPEVCQGPNNSVYSNCSTCFNKSDSANCTYCEHCAASETNYDSWMLNSTNFLSSTPANLNDSMFMVKEKKRRRSSSRVQKKSKKTISIKESQVEACSTLMTNPLKVKKVKKSSSEMISKSGKAKSKLSGKLVPRTSSSLKLSGLPAALKFDYKRQQKRASVFLNSILPTGSANSNDNFTNYGDFLVWYV